MLVGCSIDFLIARSAQVLTLIFRDFIETWYKDISDDPHFLNDLRASFQSIIVTMSNQ